MIERIGNCKIVEEVGAGGMAVVYKAIQEPLGRVVAVKALKSSIAAESQFSERFEREARFMASLQQENIINVHDFVKLGGTMFIVMEYVEGIDLYDLLDQVPKGLPVEVATIICLQVARALNHAHFRGIIHRDIKPANVMLSKRGDVKLMDFGIARDETLSDLTETGTGLGTPSYMSPEQILGDKLDQRTDIWSLGVVFYQMLTGAKPYVEDARRSVLQKIRLDRYTPARKLNPKVPRSVERILGLCMSKLPADRYPSMQALVHDLEDVLSSRVGINYNAYMVSYLKERGVVAEDEAQVILSTGAVRSAGKSAGPDRKSLRGSAVAYAASLGVMLLGGLLIQLLYSDATVVQTVSARTLGPKQVGYLEVAAEPWANVRVDGAEIDTTPFARPLSLAPGVHYVELTNPYFAPITREVTIIGGGTVRLVEKMVVEKSRSPGAGGGGR